MIRKKQGSPAARTWRLEGRWPPLCRTCLAPVLVSSGRISDDWFQQCSVLGLVSNNIGKLHRCPLEGSGFLGLLLCYMLTRWGVVRSTGKRPGVAATCLWSQLRVLRLAIPFLQPSHSAARSCQQFCHLHLTFSRYTCTKQGLGGMTQLEPPSDQSVRDPKPERNQNMRRSSY